jgi:ATP-dependent Clp protease ATP-binding subunit ClpC
MRIVDLEVNKVKARLRIKEIEIMLDAGAHEFVIEKGYDPTYGARPMRRAVERYLEDPLAEELLKGAVKAGDLVEVTVIEGKLVFHVAEPQGSEAASAS